MRRIRATVENRSLSAENQDVVAMSKLAVTAPQATTASWWSNHLHRSVSKFPIACDSGMTMFLSA